MARYAHKSDTKGRIFIPAKLRNSLGATVVVTKSLDKGYLAVYTEERFEEIRSQLFQLPGTDPLVRSLRRFIVGEAIYCDLDSQGRISISEELWTEIWVKAGDEVFVIDMGDGLELVSKSYFEKTKLEEESITELDLSAYEVKGIF